MLPLALLYIYCNLFRVIKSDSVPPTLLTYTYDANRALLNLTFSKLIDVQSFTLFGLQAQSQADVTVVGDKFRFVDQPNLQGVLGPTTNGYQTTDISVLLGLTNRNGIAKNLNLWRTKSTTYLSADRSFISDTFGNTVNLANLNSFSAKWVATYVTDVVPPRLLSWNFDMSRGMMTLYFSKYIIATLFNYSAVILRNYNDSSYPWSVSQIYPNYTIPSSVTLGNSVLLLKSVTVGYSDFMSVNFTTLQLNQIKAIPYFGRVRSQTFITIFPGAVTDSNFRAIDYYDPTTTMQNPRMVTGLVLDTVAPTIISVKLDLTLQLLVIKFSEIVSLASFRSEALTLQSLLTLQSFLVTQIYPLPVGLTYVPIKGPSSDTISIKFSTQMFYDIKQFSNLGRSQNYSFVSTTSDLVFDTATPIANKLVPVSNLNAFPVTTYVPDMIAPYLMSFSVDLTLNRLTLVFSEPLNIYKLNVAAIQLQLEPVRIISTSFYILTSSTVLYSKKDNVIILQLSDYDANNMKSRPPLCTSINNCYLSIDSSFGYDTSCYTTATKITENPVVAILNTQAIAPTNYIIDVVPPHLIRFDLDWNVGTIRLTFNEPVNFLNTTSIGFVSDTLGSNAIFLSQYDVIESSASVNVNIILTRSDYLRIKLFSELLVSNSYTAYIMIKAPAAVDMSGNYVSGAYSLGFLTPYLPVTTYTPRTNPPIIQAFYFNRSTSILSIYFSDVLYIHNSQTDIDLSGISLISLVRVSRSLVFSIIKTNFNHYVLELDVSPLLSIFNQLNILSSQKTSLMYVNKAGAVIDIPDKVPIIAMPLLSPIRMGNTPLSFRLNMNAAGTATIFVEFAYDINNVVINPSGISLFSPNNFNQFYNFTQTIQFTVYENIFLLMTLTPADYHGIQQSILQITSKNAIQMRFLPTAMVDKNRENIDLSSMTVISCIQLLKDKIEPQLLSYKVDMNAALLTLQFSEPIVVSSLLLSNLYFIDSAINPRYQINLRNSSIVTNTYAAMDIVIDINPFGSILESFPTIRDKMYLTETVGKDANSLYLYSDSAIAQDTAIPSNFLQPILIQNSQKVSQLLLDVTSPRLQYFEIDLTRQFLILVYDKAVNASTNVPGLYQLQDNTNNQQTIVFTLSASTTSLTNSDGHKVVVAISNRDMDRLMLISPTLCTSNKNCYLSLNSFAIQDISTLHNPNVAIAQRVAIAPAKFLKSLTAPNIIRFDFNMQDGIAIFYFDRIMNCSSTNVESIVIQYASFIGTSPLFYRMTSTGFKVQCGTGVLTATSVVTPTDSTTVKITQTNTFGKILQINFDYNSRAILKSYSTLVKTAATTFARFDPGAFFDTFSNTNNFIFDGIAIPVTTYVTNTIKPRLVSFTVSTQQQLSMFFTEPIDATKIIVSNIFLQDQKRNPVNTFFLSASRVTFISPLRTNIRLALLADYSRIASASNIFKFQLTTFLGASSAAAKDMFGNILVPVVNTLPLDMGPSLWNWDLDLSTNKLYFYFTENVNASTLFITKITIQSAYSSSAINYKFTAPQRMQQLPIGTSGDVTNYVITLTQIDINRLKFIARANSILESFNTFFQNSFITIPYATTTSVFQGSVVPKMKLTEIRNTSAYPIRIFTPDTIAPICLFYNLNLNDIGIGSLFLQFTEPVREDSLILPNMVLRNDINKNAVSFTSANRKVGIVNDTALLVNISQKDIYDIKSIYFQSGLLNQLFLQDRALYDFSGNFILGNGQGTLQPNVIISIKEFTPDTTIPLLLSAVLDMTLGRLILQYNEPININILLPNHIIFIPTANYSYFNGSDFDSSISYIGNTKAKYLNAEAYNVSHTIIHTNIHGVQVQLTEYSVVSVDDDYAVIVDMSLYSQDIERLREQTNVANDINNTFIAIYGVGDLFDNIDTSSLIVPITKYIPNTNLLILSAFDYLPHGATSNTGNSITDRTIINLYFQSTVDISTFHCTDFQFSNSPYDVTATVNLIILPALQSSDCQIISNTNSHMVTFSILSSYFNPLQPISNTLSNQNLYIFIPTVTVLSTKSTDNKYIAIIPNTKAIQAGPRIIKFSINMNTGEIVLVFSKSIQLLTGDYNHTNLGFFSTLTTFDFFCFNETSTSSILSPYSQLLNFNSSITHSYNDSIARVLLSIDEINSIKLLDIKQSTLALIVNNHLVKDIDNIWVAPLILPQSTADNNPQPSLLFPVKFVADNVRPALLSWNFDTGNGLIIMYFAEPIRSSSIIVTQFTLMSSDYIVSDLETLNNAYLTSLNSTDPNLGLSYTLTGGNAFSQGLVVTILLTAVDNSIIKLNPNLCKETNNTYVAYLTNTMQDMAGNAIIPELKGVQVSEFLPDIVGPVMYSFELNMNTNLLIMTFDGPVNTLVFDPTAIQLQSRYFSGNGVKYVLTGGEVVAFTLFTVTLRLTDADILAIEKIDGLCRDQASTYLIASTQLVTDVIGNPFQPVTDTFALPCSIFTPDLAPPFIIELNANANLNTLQIIFNKPIQILLVDITAIYFTLLFANEVNTTTLPSLNYQLTLSSVLHNPDNILYDTVILIDISPPDANGIKSLFPMFSSQKTTFFYITSSLTQDVFYNPLFFDTLHPIYKVNGYIADITNPILQVYNLDMSGGTVKLTFSKAVSPGSLDLSVCYISNSTDKRFDPYTILSGSEIFFGLGTTSNELTLFFSTYIINFMKYYTIGILPLKGLFSYTDKFISDYVGNYLPPRYDSSVYQSNPRVPDLYTADVLPPILIRWYIDRTVIPMKLQLFFSEPFLLNDLSQISYFAIDSNDNVIQLYFPLYVPPINNSNSGTNVTNTTNENIFIQPIPSALSTAQASSTVARLSKQQILNGLVNGNMFFESFNTIISLLIEQPCTGVNTCSASKTPSKYLDTTKYRLYLTATRTTGSDMANTMNALTPILKLNPLYESTPDCTPCSKGFYLKTGCTHDTDKICLPCSSCHPGQYVYELCNSLQDTLCHDCTMCPHSTYISTQCKAFTDTVCSNCVYCNEMEYQIQPCVGIQNTICGSCKSCYFNDPAIRFQCMKTTDRYLWWAMDNCCNDNQGNLGSCSDQERQNILIEARNGRHHWPFPITSPPISGDAYVLGQDY